jgi:hypothetical protein
MRAGSARGVQCRRAPLPPWRAHRPAGARAPPSSSALAFFFGSAWALAGVIALPLAALERWAEARGRAGWLQAGVIAWLVTCAMLPWALVQGLHASAILGGASWDEAYVAALDAYRGLSDPAFGPWSDALPWGALWSWCQSGGALATTAALTATVVTAPFVPRAVMGRRILPAEVVLTLLVVMVAPCLCFPPAVPRGHQATSAQGLGEGLALIGYLLILGVTPVMWGVADALARWLGTPRATLEPLPPLRASRFVLLALVGAVAQRLALVDAPRRLAPTPRAWALSAIVDADPKVRATATRTLGRCYGGDPDVVAGLLRAAEDADAVVRAEALSGLSVSELAPVPTPALRRALSDPDAGVRRTATMGICTIANWEADSVAPCLPELARLVATDPSEEVRFSGVLALSSLGARGVHAPETDAALLMALDRLPGGNPRYQTLMALGHGGGGPEVTAALARIAETDADPIARDCAREALERLR